MSSAQLDMLPAESGDALAVEETSVRPSALRQQMAERLAAHRMRRGRPGHSSAQGRLEIELPPVKHRIAATVAERYAQSPSYRAFLAQEAERAVQQAAAAAEIAARNAEAVVSAQQELLAELELWTAPQEFKAQTTVAPGPRVVAAESGAGTPVRLGSIGGPGAGLTVRLYEDLGRPAIAAAEMRLTGDRSPAGVPENADEALALDEEIAFRQTPMFENYRNPQGPTDPITANLVEFPRQLVAAKKARPRIAEGPLREEAPRSPQLRIFEVEAEQISNVPALPAAAPEWSSIRLEAHSMLEAAVAGADEVMLPSLLAPQTAAMPLRVMATVVDGTLIAGAFVAFAATAVYVAGAVPSGKDAVTVVVGSLTVFYLIYQLLFFTFNNQTPGMRFARIGLCTMTDENPTRAAMRKRIVAILIAACPLGIGLLWILLDDDRLGWHDRISRMYQRAY